VKLEKREPNSRNITGNIAMPGFTAPKLVWLKEFEPENFAKVAKVLLPKDYLRFLMNGDFASDMSDSAGTLWLDVEKRAWSQKMLSACDLTEQHMPTLYEGTQITGVKLLWGTANLFSNKRFCAGGATNPNPNTYAYAAAQVKHAMEITHRLGGENYVLWGGREGYDTLLNTDLAQESEQYARFLKMVVEHKKKIGFKGTLLIEPKPQEPTKHQYDYDTATVAGFLHKHGLQNEIKVNIEANHATLAGHSFHHEIAVACAEGIMGSIDANRGDMQNGWDTDQFPNDVAECTLIMYEILKNGGFTTGGFNFDTKLRRQSCERDDLFIGHIGGMDTMAKALLNAAAMIEGSELSNFVEKRYAGWKEELGQSILNGEQSLESLSALVHGQDINPEQVSGRQELLENIVNRYL